MSGRYSIPNVTYVPKTPFLRQLWEERERNQSSQKRARPLDESEDIDDETWMQLHQSFPEQYGPLKFRNQMPREEWQKLVDTFPGDYAELPPENQAASSSSSSSSSSSMPSANPFSSSSSMPSANPFSSSSSKPSANPFSSSSSSSSKPRRESFYSDAQKKELDDIINWHEEFRRKNADIFTPKPSSSRYMPSARDFDARREPDIKPPTGFTFTQSSQEKPTSSFFGRDLPSASATATATASESATAKANLPTQTIPGCPCYGKNPFPPKDKKDYQRQLFIYHPDKNPDCPDLASEKMMILASMWNNVDNIPTPKTLHGKQTFSDDDYLNKKGGRKSRSVKRRNIQSKKHRSMKQKTRKQKTRRQKTRKHR